MNQAPDFTKPTPSAIKKEAFTDKFIPYTH